MRGLGEEVAASAWDEGRAFSLEQAVAYALDVEAAQTVPGPSGSMTGAAIGAGWGAERRR